ncbi:MAG: hypothetical protein PHH82_00020 [Candidatus ainarchaeum sp.]|nr:hypothetical protein [Candidatus ainarchaeum sp.]
MRTKVLFLILFLCLLPLSFSELTGPSYALSDSNSFKTTLESNNVCSTFDISQEKYSFLKANDGILALDLYIKFTPEIESQSYLQLYINDELVKYKAISGYFMRETLEFKDFQNGRKVVFLENYRDQNSLQLKICGYVSGSVYELEMLPGSKIGSFIMPYFSGKGNFSKSLEKTLFLVDETVKVDLALENEGYVPATITLAYNNFDVNTEIKMLGGVVSYVGSAAVNEPVNITYYFKSKTDKYFLIPPARAEYTYDNYKFVELSNPIIVNAKNYLDDIDCEMGTSKVEYSLKEKANITVGCYNKSSEIKEFNLLVKVDNKEIMNNKIAMGSKEVKEMNFEYSFDNFDTKKVCGEMYLNENTKELSCTEFYFSESTSNYTLYIVGFVVLILLAVFIYYQFFL